jgi:16S rRNA (guanine527-N7)-methyltransferase
LTNSETEAIEAYLSLLTRWQKSQRLVGSIEPGWLIKNVVLDSLLFLRLLPAGSITIADLGSGAGVPGVPLKIVRPELRVTLIESRERRASFLSAVVRELGLQDCRVLGRRAEEIAPADRNQDVVVTRCAGDLSEVVHVAAALARPGGLVIASGPPRRPPTKSGLDLRWVEVEASGGARLFATYEVSASR